MIVTVRHDFISEIVEEDYYQFHYNKTGQAGSILCWVAVALLGKAASPIKKLKVRGDSDI